MVSSARRTGLSKSVGNNPPISFGSSRDGTACADPLEMPVRAATACSREDTCGPLNSPERKPSILPSYPPPGLVRSVLLKACIGKLKEATPSEMRLETDLRRRPIADGADILVRGKAN